jgi:hypothetical protein
MVREIWHNNEVFTRKGFRSENDFEEAVLEVKDDLFGPNRIYLDIKRKIGKGGRVRGIPDGYLVDLSTQKARLYLVENEIATHDPLKHIATQILQFSLSFDEDRRGVKDILYKALEQLSEIKKECEEYVKTNDAYRNLDHLIDYLVYDSPFSVLILIDEIPEALETNLMEKFQFGVELIELARYESKKGEILYSYEPFLADVDIDIVIDKETKKVRRRDISEIDTIVVPAREDGFIKVFLGEDRWYAIKIHGTMRPQIKYIAAYRVHPISAITHIAPVESIEPWKDTGKYVVNFAEPAKEIKKVKYIAGKGRTGIAPQSPRYTSFEKLKKARTVNELWGK